MRTFSILGSAALALFAMPARAQEIPKPDYVTYMPREVPRAVTQTSGSVQFRVFGDRQDAAFRDVDPADGIDDGRSALFLRLAERFAPWLVRNSYGFPMDIRRLMSESEQFPLVIDQFDLSRTEPRLVRSDSINVGTLPAAPPCPDDAPADSQSPDCRLREVLRRRGPQAPITLGPQGADHNPAEVMYFNFPGDSPAAWARRFGGASKDDVAPRYIGWAKIYMHPFVAEVEGAGEARFELVLQYWFYYPTNDGGNKHEGDWEHLNVVIAPRAVVTRPSRPDEIEAMLAGRVAEDELVIRRVEYYFHHWVMPLDYTSPNVYASRAEWTQQVKLLPPDRRGADLIAATVRRNAYVDRAESGLNLHPFVFIGGNDRGFGQILHAPTRLGRSSHASYPFPGLYKGIGPAGSGESIDRSWGVLRRPPAADAPESEPVVRFDNPSRLEILPDWEMIAERALVEPEIRKRWAWLLLPAYQGYPATVSPLAGVVKYAETGNLAILPPTYSGGWNRLGDGAGFAYYIPNRVAGVFPSDLQDTFRPSWGVLNLTVPLLSLLPPFDVAFRSLETPVRAATASEQPRFLRAQDIPFRGIGVSGGTVMFNPGDTFWRLVGFPELATPFLQQALQRTGGSLGGIGLGRNPRQTRLVGGYGEMSFYLGRHFVSTNGLSHGRSRLSQAVFINGQSTDTLTADLNFWEYLGDLRYNLATERFQPFLMGGYGLSWYRLEDARAFGVLLGDGTSRWVRKPGLIHNLLPNTWHIGSGVELLPERSRAGLDLGLKASAALHVHSLGLTTGNATTVFFQNGTVTRWVFSLSATISY